MNRSNFQNKSVSIIFALLLNIGCKKTDTNLSSASSAAEITDFSIAGATTQAQIMPSNQRINLQLPGTISSGDNLIAEFKLSNGAQAKVDNVAQLSGSTQNNFRSDIEYVVTAANHTEKKWTVSVTNNDHSYDWGMGHFINTSVSNNRDYEWYKDQGNSGQFSPVNCGPTSVTMAIKWADSTFSRTPEDARNTYLENGGWWTTDDIDHYLRTYSIPHATIPIAATATLTQELLKKQLDLNNIIILCIDMNYVRNTDKSSYHRDKFYLTSPGWGHFFVIKGYEQVDNVFYFEIYDPFSNGLTNADDGKLKGRSRFYNYDDVFGASNNWWKYAMVIGQKGQTLDISTRQIAVDPSIIKPGTSARSF